MQLTRLVGGLLDTSRSGDWNVRAD
jgi:hypothetical protein